MDTFSDDDMGPGETAAELERIAAEVDALLTPEELAIRRWHVEILVGLGQLLAEAAGEH